MMNKIYLIIFWFVLLKTNCYADDSVKVGSAKCFNEIVTIDAYKNMQKQFEKKYPYGVDGPEPEEGVELEGVIYDMYIWNAVISHYILIYKKHDVKSYYKMLFSKDEYTRKCGNKLLLICYGNMYERAFTYNPKLNPDHPANVSARGFILKNHPELGQKKEVIIPIQHKQRELIKWCLEFKSPFRKTTGCKH